MVNDAITVSSTLPEARAAEAREQDCKQVQIRAKLRLIEEVDILQDDTAGKRSTVSVPLNQDFPGAYSKWNIYYNDKTTQKLHLLFWCVN